MSRIWIAVGLLGVLVSFATGRVAREAPKTTVVDEHFGYRLEAPEFPGKPGLHTRMTILGPPSEGFSPNVNVTIQPPSTLDAYLGMSKSGVEASGLKIDSERKLKVSGRDAAIFEYHGNMQGRELAFLSLAVMGEEHVYLVTCTATPTQMQANEAAFEKCLKSFELLQPSKP